MNWLKKFLYGRYGSDHLSIALLFLSLLLSIVFMFFPATILNYIVYIPFIVFLFRVLSKNIAKRREENNKFLKLWNPILAWFRKKQYRLQDSKTHKHYSCPSCKQEVRVPKGKGKIRITCPKCKMEFIKKT
jgi:predicted membrane protein